MKQFHTPFVSSFVAALLCSASAFAQMATPALPANGKSPTNSSSVSSPAPSKAAEGATASPDLSTVPTEASDAAATPGPRIYLVTRIKLSGTDLTQVVFFQHPAMSTMEACEAERNRGLMNQWNYFGRFYLKTLKGVSYKVDYRCVEGETRMAYWRQGVPNSISYLVRTVDNQLKVSEHRNFFACRDALRAIAKEESVDNFCAVSSQTILPDAPQEQPQAPDKQNSTSQTAPPQG